MKIIRIFSIAEHGKGEVDHVGGVAKTAVRLNVAGGFFENAAQIVQFLQTKFSYKSNPSYYVKEIDPQVLNEAREKAQFKKIENLDGSSSFQVMVFNPHSSEVLASTRLCLCDKCKAEMVLVIYSLHMN